MAEIRSTNIGLKWGEFSPVKMATQIKPKKTIHISHQNLPFACPPQNMPQLAHPKVFLNFKEKVATCPYCGTTYVIDDKVAPPQAQ